MLKATKTKKQGGGTKTPYKKNVYALFVEWVAMTKEDRLKRNLPFAQDFAKKYGVHPGTLSEWQDRPDFGEAKRKAQIKHLSMETSDVLKGLKDRCQRYGMAYDVELFLLYVEGWERKRQIELMGEVKLGNDDLRSVIELLPKEKQAKFYDTLTELIAEAEAVRSPTAA